MLILSTKFFKGLKGVPENKLYVSKLLLMGIKEIDTDPVLPSKDKKSHIFSILFYTESDINNKKYFFQLPVITMQDEYGNGNYEYLSNTIYNIDNFDTEYKDLFNSILSNANDDNFYLLNPCFKPVPFNFNYSYTAYIVKDDGNEAIEVLLDRQTHITLHYYLQTISNVPNFPVESMFSSKTFKNMKFKYTAKIKAGDTMVGEDKVYTTNYSFYCGKEIIKFNYRFSVPDKEEYKVKNQLDKDIFEAEYSHLPAIGFTSVLDTAVEDVIYIIFLEEDSSTVLIAQRSDIKKRTNFLDYTTILDYYEQED